MHWYKKIRIYDILHTLDESNKEDQNYDELYELMDPVERKKFKKFKDEKLFYSAIRNSDLLGKT
jgi:hypothetical protein